MYKCLMGEIKEDRDRMFSVVSSDRPRGNRHKLKYKKNPLKHTNPSHFTIRVVKRWNRWPKEVVESPSLEITKT